MDVLSVKVTKINKNYHARLFVNGKIGSEWACRNRRDIGYICRQLLRWYDKMGGVSTYAEKSRHRGKTSVPIGTVYGPAQLPIRKH